MSNTIPKRTEVQGESRQSYVERLRASIRPMRAEKETVTVKSKGLTFLETVAAIRKAQNKEKSKEQATSIVQVGNSGAPFDYTFIGSPTMCYIEERVRDVLALQDVLRVSFATHGKRKEKMITTGFYSTIPY